MNIKATWNERRFHYEKYSYRKCDEEYLKDITSFYYGDISDNNQGELIELPYISHSDYSGTTVERSNYEYLIKEYSDLLGIILWESYGGYSTRAIFCLYSIWEIEFQDDEYLGDRIERLKEDIKSIDDYPLLDEELMSEIEMNIEIESWDDWVCSDLKHTLLENEIYDEEDNPLPEDSILQDMLHFHLESLNEYYEFESPYTAYLDIKKIVNSWSVHILEYHNSNQPMLFDL